MENSLNQFAGYNSIYEFAGYKNRDHYYECLADGFEIDLKLVVDLSKKLGQEEDFNELIMELEESYGN